MDQLQQLSGGQFAHEIFGDTHRGQRGSATSAMSISSNPTTARSSGTRSPASRAASITPSAMASLTAKMHWRRERIGHAEEPAPRGHAGGYSGGLLVNNDRLQIRPHA